MVALRRIKIPLILLILSFPFLEPCEAKSLPDFAILTQIQGKIKAGTAKKNDGGNQWDAFASQA